LPTKPDLRFAQDLLRFFDAGKRDLPWRRRPSAYHTLVSELMLQQTVVATVVPYFERFTARFPDLAALAAADEGAVLALWSGLGYYSRARNLHRTARAVMEQNGGELPADEAALLALPGVGPYTAAAIAAIAFGVRTFPLDGNGARVFARVFAETRAIDLPAVRVDLRKRALALVPAERPGDFAQAVMDLGATVCTPGTPRCAGCPVAAHCRARRQGSQSALPVRIAKAEKRVVTLVCVLFERAGRILLVRRPAGTLLGGTFTPPAEECGPGDESDAVARTTAKLGVRAAGPAKALGSFRHVFTHRDVTASVYRVPVAALAELPADARWVAPADHEGIALATFTRKALALRAADPVRPAAAQRKARMASPPTT
jgi:A/G-specific adenine glycosylase